MSDVTAREVVEAVAKAWGYSLELVKAGGPEPISRAERSGRLQARMVAAWLIGVHTAASRTRTLDAIGLKANSSGFEFLDTAAALVEPFRGYDERMSKRLAKAEAIIDDIHERRVDARMRQLGRALQEARA